MLVALIVSGISALFSYLNTGADRSTMLHTEINKVEQYLPKLVWEPLTNEGRPIDIENLNYAYLCFKKAFRINSKS